MVTELKDPLEREYGFEVAALSEAPRQFVAETFSVTSTGGERYFCKVVDKPLFVPTIIGGLPALDELHRLGVERICHPLPTKTGAFYAERGKAIVVLYNFIDAPQSYDYDPFALGRLLGRIHALTPRLESPIPRDSFDFDHRALFDEQFAAALSGQDGSDLNQRFQALMGARQNEIEGYYALLDALIEENRFNRSNLALTHGDAGGNVLVKSPTDIYIVDWDEIWLAPKERDLWVAKDEEGFLEGYRSAIPGAVIDQTALRFCVVRQFFYYMLHFFSELFGDKPEDYKREMLEGLEGLFTGWMRPYLDGL